MMSRLRRPIHAGLSAACLGPPLGLAVRRTLSRHPRLLDRLGWSEERRRSAGDGRADLAWPERVFDGRDSAAFVGVLAAGCG